MAYINLNNPANYQLQDFGQMGFRVIDSTHINVDGETYRTIYVLEDAVVTALTAKADDITSKALLAGTLLHGLFSDVSVTSGKVLAYMAGRLTASEILALYNAYLIAEGAVIEGSDCVESELNSLTTDTYADASLVLIPSGYDTGVVYGQRPLDARSQIDFTRASTATRVNASGLIEKAKVNLLLQSNQFDTTWTNSNTTETGGQAGYDGSSDAWLLSKSNAFGLLQQNISGSNVSTLSVYIKAGSLNWAWIILRDSVGGDDAEVYINLTNGSLGSSGGGAFINATTEDAGSGWHRCIVVSSGGYDMVRIAPADGDGDLTGTSGSIYIQDAQLEQGLVATDYIATTTSARSTFAGITVDGTSVLNVPRLDYSGGASCPSLLLEPSRTNVITHSELLTDSSWINQLGGTIDVGQVSGVSGYNDAWKLNKASGTFKSLRLQKTLTTNNYTLSWFLKAGTISIAEFRFDGGLGSQFIDFDLSSGTHGTNANLSNIEMTAFNDGWYRCSASINTDLTNVHLYVDDVSVSSGAGYIYAQYPQLEVGTYPTSYIPTYGTSVTRVADSAYKTGISSLIGQTEGVIFIDATLSDVIDTSNIRGLIELNDGTTNNRFSIYRGANSTDITALIFTIAVQKSATVSALSGRVKIAIAYDSNGSSFYFNGTLAGTEAAITYPACSELDLGIITSNTNRVLGDGINQALLFKTRLSNEELASLTTL